MKKQLESYKSPPPPPKKYKTTEAKNKTSKTITGIRENKTVAKPYNRTDFLKSNKKEATIRKLIYPSQSRLKIPKTPKYKSLFSRR